MDNITLSIIIPCYNVPTKILAKCLDSLLFISELMPFEVWIIDDGSTKDEICKWVATLGKENIHAIRQKNMGPGGARNTGIEHATGSHITFVDADDYLLYGPYYMILKELKEKQPDILCFGCKANYEGSALKYMMTRDICPSCWTYIIKRSILGNLRFSPNLYHEDEEFCTKLHLKRAHLLTILENGYFYRYRPDSIIHSTSKKHIEKRFNDYIAIIHHLQNEEVKKTYRAALERRLDIMAMCYVVTLMRDTPSIKFTIKSLKNLKGTGLFPLPLRWHGWRYLIIKLAMFNTLPVLLFTPLIKLLLKIHHMENKDHALVANDDHWIKD